MCIIIAKPINVAMPSEEIIRNCFSSNPHGAGFMLNYNGLVYGFKGFMHVEHLIDAIKQVEKQIGDLTPRGVVLHFRIGTHGNNDQANTHPFPLSADYEDMKKLQWVARQGFAHNGIITKTTRHPDVELYGVSDTMVFGKLFAAPIAGWTNIATDQDALNVLDVIADSKLAFMDGEGNISTCGSFIKDEGLLFSNYSYHSYGYGWDEDMNIFDYAADTAKYSRKKRQGALGAAAGLSKKAVKQRVARGLKPIDHITKIYAPGTTFDGSYAYRGHAFNPKTGCIYQWDPGLGLWDVLYGYGITKLRDEVDNIILYERRRWEAKEDVYEDHESIEGNGAGSTDTATVSQAV
jgi:hypothetical protein